MNTTPTIYLDHAATSPLKDEVIIAMTQVMREIHGNPSSLHSLGRQASKLLREQRQRLGELLQSRPERFIFTSGGTESNNLAIKGYALANRSRGKHLITSQMEHHSVLDTIAYLEKHFGFEVTYLPPTEDGIISPNQLRQALRPDTILVSLIWVNNETGHINPIADLAQVIKDHQAVFHVDGVQGVGKLAISPEQLGIDFLSASAHKFHGPKGVGFLYAKEYHLDKLFHGGSQEGNRRASTENLAGITGLVTALELAYERLDDTFQQISQLKSLLLSELNPELVYLNSPSQALPHVINLGLTGQHNAQILTRLDLEGFAVSTGSACTAGNVEPSHVLTALYGKTSLKIRESIRISLSSLNTEQDIIAFAKTINHILG